MARVKLTQVKSGIDQPKDQKATLIALGIKRNQTSVEKELNPQIQGMINKVKHLLKVEEI